MASKDKLDTYQLITNRVIKLLENGVVPWRNPMIGTASNGLPCNLVSDQPYRGINVFLLALTAFEQGFGSRYWVTYKQAVKQGGHVKKGEKSTLVVFYKQLTVDDEKTDKTKQVPMLRHYRVFNLQQCEGIEIPDADPRPKEPVTDFEPIDAAEQIVRGFPQPPQIELHDIPRAFYNLKLDTVKIPKPEGFESTEQYYATLLHELSHATGHQSRLNRYADGKSAEFGSLAYGKEELIAEMSAAFLCAECRIDPVTIEQTAAYIQSWLTTIKKDKRLVVQAAAAAQKSADWILNRHNQTQR